MSCYFVSLYNLQSSFVKKSQQTKAADFPACTGLESLYALRFLSIFLRNSFLRMKD